MPNICSLCFLPRMPIIALLLIMITLANVYLPAYLSIYLYLSISQSINQTMKNNNTNNTNVSRYHTNQPNHRDRIGVCWIYLHIVSSLTKGLHCSRRRERHVHGRWISLEEVVAESWGSATADVHRSVPVWEEYGRWAGLVAVSRQECKIPPRQKTIVMALVIVREVGSRVAVWRMVRMVLMMVLLVLGRRVVVFEAACLAPRLVLS